MAGRLKFNFYCLQVTFCAIITWLVLINIILYVVLPKNLPNEKRSKRTDASFVPLTSVLTEFLDLCSFLAIKPILIQPNVLERIIKNDLLWSKFSQRSSRVITFVSTTEFDCDLLKRNFAQIVSDTIFCTEDGLQFLAKTKALTIHLVASQNFGSKPYVLLPSTNTFPELFLTQPLLFEFRLFNVQMTEIDDVNLILPLDISTFLQEINNAHFIECNTSRASDFFARYPKMESMAKSSEALEFKRKVRHLLSQAASALYQLKIPFWLSSGTLLGWFRQCDVIPYCRDADMGIFIEDYDHDLISAFEERGLQLKMQLGLVNDSFQLSFLAKDVKLDIYFFYRNSDYVWNGATKPETGEKFKYWFSKFKLCWTDFLEMDFLVRVPCPTDIYIIENYGENWMEPVTEWIWNKSPPNVKANGIWNNDLITDAIQIFHND